MMQSTEGTPELGDLVRLCNESVVLQAVALRQGFDDKSEFIAILSGTGFPNSRIAEFLGETTDSVRSAVNRAKKKRG